MPFPPIKEGCVVNGDSDAREVEERLERVVEVGRSEGGEDGPVAFSLSIVGDGRNDVELGVAVLAGVGKESI